MKTLLIDYGAGNLHSVHKALVRAGFEVLISDKPSLAQEVDALVLPGQGHFGQVMESFLASGFEPVVRTHIEAKRPFLGICVGLQLLMNKSEEASDMKGLGILAGEVKRFKDSTVSIPQMGWNQFYGYGNPPLLEGISNGSFAYFANSYYVDFDDDSIAGATTTYGNTTFKSVISQGHIHATQFHPEKSQSIGLKILDNFRKVVQEFISPT